jgi:PAS domain S-box-containing protein
MKKIEIQSNSGLKRWLPAIIPFRWGVILVTLLFLGRITFSLIISDSEQFNSISSVYKFFEGLIAIATLFYTYRHARMHNQQLSRAWGFLLTGLTLAFFGEIAWIIYILIINELPTPSIADLLYILSYIFLWLGLYNYPLNSKRGSEYKYIWLDNIVVILSSGLFFMVLFIEPITAFTWGNLSQFKFWMIYPILDLVLLWSLLSFFRNRPEKSSYPPILLIGLGLFIVFAGDCYFSYQGLVGISDNENIADLVFALGYMVTTLAGFAQVSAFETVSDLIPGPEAKKTSRQSWPVYLPYFWLIVSFTVLFINGASPTQKPVDYLVIGTTIILVVLRQVLTLRENETLFLNAETELNERIAAQDALRQAQYELENRIEDRTKQLAEANSDMVKLNKDLTEANKSLREEVTERMYIQAELDKTRIRQEYMLSNSPAVIYTSDIGGEYPPTYISKNIEKQMGYSVDKFFENHHFWIEHIHPDDFERVMESFDSLVDQKNLSNEYRFMHQSGEWRWIQDDVRIIFNEEGTPVEVLGSMIDITTRKHLEAEILNSLHEKEILLKEIHHRVKNNLQVISSLLSLQSAQIKDPVTVQLFRDSQNRVRSMALIHEKLYQSSDLARIDIKEYIQSLSSYLVRSFAAEAQGVNFRIEIDQIRLGIDQAIPCGLIINELVSNSLKYAFPDSQKGEVTIQFKIDEGQRFHLNIGDNGIGFPKNIDFQNTVSLGLQLVNSLVNQLEGSIELFRSGGTEFRIDFCETA